MKLIAWLLLCILCMLLMFTGFGIIIAVPLFFVGTLFIMFAGFMFR